MTGNRKNRALTHQGAELKTRVARTRSRAQFVGIIYFISIILLATTAFLPFFDVEKQQHAPVGVLAALKVFEPANLQALKTWAGMLTFINALLYLTMLLVVVINVVRASAKLGWLFKKKASYTYGFNRNAYAMDKLADIFTGSFATFVTWNLLIYLVAGNATIGMFGFVGLGAGVAIHFLAGIAGGKVTLFTIDDNIEEEPRPFGLFVYFVRNLLQIAVVAAVLFFFVPNATFGAALPNMVSSAVNGDIAALIDIPVLVEFVAWLCIFVLIRHAVAETEFNRDCIDGTGMKNFRVFAFFTALAIGAIIALPMVGMAPEAELNMELVYAAAAAFVGFLVDCIIKSREPKEKKVEEEIVEDTEDVAVEDYLRESAEIARYKNTII